LLIVIGRPGAYRLLMFLKSMRDMACSVWWTGGKVV
jgi:hypothetical protein